MRRKIIDDYRSDSVLYLEPIDPCFIFYFVLCSGPRDDLSYNPGFNLVPPPGPSNHRLPGRLETV